MKKLLILISIIFFFSCGVKDGKHISYYENGQISQEGNYKDGKTNPNQRILNEKTLNTDRKISTNLLIK